VCAPSQVANEGPQKHDWEGPDTFPQGFMLKLSDHCQKTSHGTARRRCQIPRGDAGSLFGLLMGWLAGKLRLSVEKVNTLFRRLAIPAVKAALR